MGRQATAPSRAQKWQVARNESASVDLVRTTAEVPSEDEHGGSTRIPSSGGASPSASSTELGRQAPFAAGDATEASRKKTAAEIQKEKDERARWCDVESDGEEGVVFGGEYRNACRAEPEGWTSMGNKKPKNVKPPQKARPAKSETVAAKYVEEAPKPAVYRPPVPKPESRQSMVQASRRAYAEAQAWEAQSWGSSAKHGHSSWSHGASDGWDESDWGHQKAEVHSHKSDFRNKGRGVGKEKNESFKRGPHVNTTMDSSRLAW